MKYFDWNEAKNKQLRAERDISFEDILLAVDEGRILDKTAHPNQKRYPHQKVFVVAIHDYAYLVPFVEDEEKIFLKTIIPSRKATQRYFKKPKK